MEEYSFIEFDSVTKEFPGVTALDDVSFGITKGSVHALVGENGAGKSTLIKLLTGVYKPDAGSISYRGKPYEVDSPLDAQKEGISVVHQELNLVEEINVCENIFLGRPLEKRILGLNFINWKMMERESSRLLATVNADIDIGEKIGNLSVAQKQLVEIAKAISFSCEVMVMDEPSATLTDKELEALFSLIEKLSERGVTIVYISHRLEEIFRIADSVTVLRDGKHIITMSVPDTNRNELISYMVGRNLEEEYPKQANTPSGVVLSVRNVCNSRLKNVSLDVRSGEILGIAGLVGAGRTELARAVFGVDPIESGEIVLPEKGVRVMNIYQAIKNGIALVPEDRKAQGLILDMSVKINIGLSSIKNVENGIFISRRAETKVCSEYIDKLKIVTPGMDQIVKNLSGGNQQKVVLAKWLLADSDIFIFDEPTRGIDVGAKYEIYLLLNELVRSGKTVIMISSELPELLGICDRIVVMHDGKITGELDYEEASQEKIMDLAAG